MVYGGMVALEGQNHVLMETQHHRYEILGRGEVDGTTRTRNNMLHERVEFLNLKAGYIWEFVRDAGKVVESFLQSSRATQHLTVLSLPVKAISA